MQSEELEARIEALFSDSADARAVVCSSVHRAKGLEAPRVFVLEWTLIRQPLPGRPPPGREEQNIEYVAITRAQQELVWVRETMPAQEVSWLWSEIWPPQNQGMYAVRGMFGVLPMPLGQAGVEASARGHTSIVV